MSEPRLFSNPGEGDWSDTPEGNRRRVILHTPELMMVEFVFRKGSVGNMHSHPHVQASFVAEGSFEVTIDGKTQTIAAGGAYIVPSGLLHGVKALEDGRLIDSFTPYRREFLD